MVAGGVPILTGLNKGRLGSRSLVLVVLDTLFGFTIIIGTLLLPDDISFSGLFLNFLGGSLFDDTFLAISLISHSPNSSIVSSSSVGSFPSLACSGFRLLSASYLGT